MAKFETEKSENLKIKDDIMLICCLYIKGIINYEFVTQTQATQKFHLQILEYLRSMSKTTIPWPDMQILYHDIVPSCTKLLVKGFLVKKKTPV
jgi:hypothetical protein